MFDWDVKRKKSTIGGNTGGCADQYKCASVLYLMSVMSQCYSVIIYHISAPGHGKEVIDVINSIDKRYIFFLFLAGLCVPMTCS